MCDTAAYDEAVAALLAHVRSGDVLLMNRNCLAMRDVLGVALCLLSKTESRFDHAGMLLTCTPAQLAAMPATRQRLRDAAPSPSHTYVVETNTSGVTVCAAEQRMRRSTAHEFVVRPLHRTTRTTAVADTTTGTATVASATTTATTATNNESSSDDRVDVDDDMEARLRREVERVMAVPYRRALRDYAASFCSPPDKMDRVAAAHKYNALAHERAALAQMRVSAAPDGHGNASHNNNKDDGGSRDATTTTTTCIRAGCYTALDAAYARAQRFLARTYFPHLCDARDDGDDACAGAAVYVDWSGTTTTASTHFAVDGVNDARAMVCSELVGNVWHRAGLTNGYVPASSLRPFDFLDATRFNFVDAATRLGALAPLKVSDTCTHHWPPHVLSPTRYDERTMEATTATSADDDKTSSRRDGDDATHARAVAALQQPPSPVTACMAPLHARAAVVRAAAAASSSSLLHAEEARLHFVNATRVADVQTSNGSNSSSDDGKAFASLQDAAAATCPLGWCWLVQSCTYSAALQPLPWRIFACGMLFSVCALPCAPLLLRSTEAQLGVLLVRGTLWSLACGMLARNVCFAATQGMTAAVLVRVFAPRDACVMRPCRNNNNNNNNNNDSATVTTTMLPPPPRTGLVDWRHPYYSVAAVWATSAMLAHAVATPVLNLTLAHHFGPRRPGPLPRRRLLCGLLALAPAQWLLPYTGCWLAWYETVGALIVPTRSSVLRPRADLLQRDDWPHLRRDALAGAALATLGVDVWLYARESRVRRRYTAALYAPQRTPSLGRRRLAGYHYRLASNALIFAATTYVLGALSLL